VLADGVGANLERAGFFSTIGHGALLLLAAAACAASIGLRTRKDQSALPRGVSSALFGALAAAYTFGLVLMEQEVPVAIALLVLLCAVGGGLSFAASSAVAGFFSKRRQN